MFFVYPPRNCNIAGWLTSRVRPNRIPSPWTPQYQVTTRYQSRNHPGFPTIHFTRKGTNRSRGPITSKMSATAQNKLDTWNLESTAHRAADPPRKLGAYVVSPPESIRKPPANWAAELDSFEVPTLEC